MEIILGLLAFAGVCLLIVKLIDTAEEAYMGKEGWAEFQKAVYEEGE